MSHYFIGIDLPEPIKQYLRTVQDKLASTFSYKQWTENQDFHITLTFLGGVDDIQLSKLTDQLKLLHHSTFSLSIDHLGIFGNRIQPRVLWAGINNPNELGTLHRQVNDTVSLVGFPTDKRSFKPHITLGKKWSDPALKLDGKTMELLQEKSYLHHPSFEVNEIHLYQIFPNRMPKYSKFMSFPLCK